MLQIEDLTKIYNSTKKIKTVALSNVSLTLPNKGFVIVLGKSGCGKSTFLNVLSTLDAKTKGKISYNGLDYDALSEKEKTVLRNTDFGFAFQRDALVEELTVLDNLKIVLDISEKTLDLQVFRDYLKEFGLHEDYLKKYPSELSAGERARVSLLRALIKKPRVLFADEPTGNVDHSTSLLILNILEKYSKEMLIVMVTHNQDDAYSYADRIITLQDGKIISDLSKNGSQKNAFFVDSYGNSYLPFNKSLNYNELKLLNYYSKNPNTRIYQNGYNFSTTKSENYKSEEVSVNKIKGAGLFKYSYKFLLKRSFFVVLMSFIVAFLLVVGNIGYNLSTYNCEESRQNYALEMYGNGSAPVFGKYKTISEEEKGITSLEEIPESDIDEIEKCYDGKVYKMYPVSLFYYGARERQSGKKSYISRPYLYNQTNGTIICDLNYLKKLFGNEKGELTLAAGEIKEHSAGVIITDYMADCFAYDKFSSVAPPTTYEEILNFEFNFGLKVDAVIDTNYEEKFASEISEIIEHGDEVNDASAFYDELFDYYSSLFSINPNFINDYVDLVLQGDDLKFDAYFNKNNIVFNDKEIQFDFTDLRISFDHDIKGNEIKLNLELLNTLTDKDYKNISEVDENEYKNANITLRSFTSYFSDSPKISYDNLKIINLFPLTGVEKIYVSPELFKEILLASYTPIRLYFEDYNLSDELISLMKEKELSSQYLMDMVYFRAEEVILLFADIFQILLIVMLVLAFFFVILVVFLILRKDKSNIGIFRALGLQISQINKLYVNTLIVMMILSCAFLFIGTYLGNNLCNGILIESVERYLGYGALPGLNFLYYNFASTIVLALFILLYILIALLIPYIVIKRNKPIEILRNNE